MHWPQMYDKRHTIVAQACIILGKALEVDTSEGPLYTVFRL